MPKQVYAALICAVVIFAGTVAPAGAQNALLKQLEAEFIQISDNVLPAVVHIEVTGKRPRAQDMRGFEEFFRRFLPFPDDEEDENGGGEEEQDRPPQRMPQSRATGSGFIYTPNGYIITNNHVVDGAEDILVHTIDERVYKAEVVGTDPETDLAVIKIEPAGDLPTVNLGSSENIKIGQFAIALGSPNGLEGSVSFGHISGLGRETPRLRDQSLRFRGFLQTDAAINLGNSGGPLVNIDGEVIGINIAIVYGANSLGFAIPVDRAKVIVPQLIDTGKVTRAYLGVQITDLHPVATEAGVPDVNDFAEALGLPDKRGAYVRVTPNEDTPAARAGIKEDDFIRKINGNVVLDSADLVDRISMRAPGDTVKLEVWREGEPIMLDVTLAEWQGMRQATLGSPILGMYVSPLEEELARHLAPEEDISGVLVRHVESGGLAEEHEIQPGDIIMKVAYQDVTDVKSLRQLVAENARPGKVLLLKIYRPNRGEMPKGIKIPDDYQPE